MTHDLKCEAPFFQAAWVGDKTFEIRKNDRNFKERDEIVLNEIDAEMNYTGRRIEGFIRYMTTYNQMTGYVVFTLEITGKFDD